jgi:hypothetical protein
MMDYFDLYGSYFEDDIKNAPEPKMSEMEERVHNCELAICGMLDRLEALELKIITTEILRRE